MSKPVAKIIKDALKNKGYDFINIRFCGANYHGPAEWYFKVSKLDMDFILKEADDYFSSCDFQFDAEDGIYSIGGDKENILEIVEFLPCKTPLPTPPQD